LVDLGLLLLLGVGLLKNEVEETMEGGVAHGFNAATPFAGVFPLNVLVALPNISDVSALIVLSSTLESKGALANRSLLFSND